MIIFFIYNFEFLYDCLKSFSNHYEKILDYNLKFYKLYHRLEYCLKIQQYISLNIKPLFNDIINR